MKTYFLILFCIATHLSFAQSDSLFLPHTDSIQKSISNNKKWQWFPPKRDTLNNKLILRNEKTNFGRKFLRAEGIVLGIQGTTMGILFALPASVSNWDKENIKNYRQNYKRAFTQKPVVDKDHWYINYIGHPYQGSYYYNAMRSQGAKFWQAGLFSFGQSMVWEYLLESGIEQPSIQDIIVTPVLGSLLGELFHFSSIKMAKNGYKWYEKAFISVFNPMFAINNAFKFAKQVNVPMKTF